MIYGLGGGSNCVFFVELLTDFAAMTLSMFFFCSFFFIDPSDLMLTCLNFFLWIPEICKLQSVRLSKAQFALVM